MRYETKEFLKDNLVRINELKQSAREKLGLTWFRQNLIKLYFKSPSKVQYALAKYGVKALLHKKKAQLEDLIKH